MVAAIQGLNHKLEDKLAVQVATSKAGSMLGAPPSERLRAQTPA